jgi:hypothetical protein
MKRIVAITCAALGLVAFLLPSPGVYGSPRDIEGELGIGMGIWLSGDINIDGTDVNKDGGFLLRLIGDYYVTPKFAVGAYFNLSRGEIEGVVDYNCWEFGASLKPRFLLTEELSLKPGINIGYRRSVLKAGGFTSDDVDGLAINLSVELQYHIGTGLIPFLDIGFLSQPAGGTTDADVTWPPIVYLSAGVAYGF